MNQLIHYILLYTYYMIDKYFIHLKKNRVVFKVNTSLISKEKRKIMKKVTIINFKSLKINYMIYYNLYILFQMNYQKILIIDLILLYYSA